MKVTANDIVQAINLLRTNIVYNYINPSTRTQIKIVNVIRPLGPIYIKRFNPEKGETLENAITETISTNMIWRIANAITPNRPINFDRILGGSYNTRSALEALLAHTPQYYWCLPGRIENTYSSTEIKRGHKHLVWIPDNPHEPGQITKIETDIVISETPAIDIVYDALTLVEADQNMDINMQRRHAQIQIALILIGLHFKFRVWVAQNDKGIKYKNVPLGEMEGVLPALGDVELLSAFQDAALHATFIDCIWFRNKRFMPAVFEVEHTTGITSGLTRMLSFCEEIPDYPTRWVIVAPDEDRMKVIEQANKAQFLKLNTKFLPYSAVEELYSLCQRRDIRGINEEFFDCFMEPCVIVTLQPSDSTMPGRSGNFPVSK